MSNHHHSQYDCCNEGAHGYHHGSQGAFAYLVPWCKTCGRPAYWCACKEHVAVVPEKPVDRPPPGKEPVNSTTEAPPAATESGSGPLYYVDHELLFDSRDEQSPEARAWIGGTTPVMISVEYIRVSETKECSVSVYEHNFGSGEDLFGYKGELVFGYHTGPLKRRVPPGSTIVLSGTGVVARIRWVESLAR